MKQNRWLGLIALAAAVLIAFVWVPVDVESGLIEKARRSIQIGDAFAPTVAAFVIGLGGVLVLVARPDIQPCSPPAQLDSVSLKDFLYALVVLLIITIALGLMRYAGPVAVGWFNTEISEYRLLRDTAPWKYIGFILGGTFLVASLTAWTERKFKLMHVWIGLLATLALIALYDLPFDDLLLPPNGDV